MGPQTLFDMGGNSGADSPGMRLELGGLSLRQEEGRSLKHKFMLDSLGEQEKEDERNQPGFRDQSGSRWQLRNCTSLKAGRL